MDYSTYFRSLKPDLQSWDPVYFSLPRKPSAVAIIIFENEQESNSVLFIRRSTRLSSHKGQIGFPGGRLEVGDIAPKDTALRETMEEIGLDPSSVEVVGRGDPTPALDGSLVYPIVAKTSATINDLNLNPAEVSEIFLVPIEMLFSSQKKKFKFNLFGCWRASFLYDCGSILVWGLSAEILSKLGIDPPLNINTAITK
jgi:8-oxo-dGTP pyrophosphatase MutT (NUDIX family)